MPLVYGVTEASEAFDFSSINVPLATVLEAAAEQRPLLLTQADPRSACLPTPTN